MTWPTLEGSRVMSTFNRMPGRLAVGISVLALTGGMTGCGDSDDGGDGNGQAAAKGSAAPPASGSATDQIQAAFAQMADAIAEADGASACPVLEQSQADAFARAGKGSCAKGFDLRIRGATEVRALDPKFQRAIVNGPNAEVKAVVKGEQAPRTATMIKQDGRWKVAKWLGDRD